VVLEVGCGTGRLLAAMADHGAIGIGLDKKEAMLEVATRRGTAALVQGDAAVLPFAPESFDALVAVTLLEFVPDPGAVMAELCRVTRPGGRVVIGALNTKSPWGLAHHHRLRRASWTGAHFLDRDELLALGRSCGPASLRGSLLAPGPIPGLSHLGPALESVARCVPQIGAFQVLVIERMWPTGGR